MITVNPRPNEREVIDGEVKSTGMIIVFMALAVGFCLICALGYGAWWIWQ